jgi:hypothetical protein
MTAISSPFHERPYRTSVVGINLTAGLAAMARRGELWATEAVVAATRNQLTWQPQPRAPGGNPGPRSAVFARR